VARKQTVSPENKPAAHTRAWETAETVFGIPFLAGLVLGYLFPLPLSAWVPRTISASAGILLLSAGLAIVVTARRQFNRAGQPTDPGNPTTQLITTGIFSWSRNPLYLGAVVIFIGLGALLNSLWLLILLAPTLIAVHFILIVPEERYLEAKFGQRYREYARSVHRWLGRRREPPSA
jgi:protein-S-isoprenylcysteine O-methyltransferase Ste14